MYQTTPKHWNDVIMSATASQITSLTIVCSTVYSGADQRKHQGSASLAFVWGIHRWPVNSPHKGLVTQKMFPFDVVIMSAVYLALSLDQWTMEDWWECGMYQTTPKYIRVWTVCPMLRIDRDLWFFFQCGRCQYKVVAVTKNYWMDFPRYCFLSDIMWEIVFFPRYCFLSDIMWEIVFFPSLDHWNKMCHFDKISCQIDNF